MFAAFAARTADSVEASHGHASAPIWSSALGGLFYLLPLVLELGIGESLWYACLPEGVVLSRVIGAVAGDRGDDDPAPRLFGGVAGAATVPMITMEQQREIGPALFASFVEAIPRRAIATWPEPLLRLVDAPSGRLLIAAAGDSPFAFFAMPANSAREVIDALEAFLTTWPASAPHPRSEPALAELDRRARVRPAPRHAATRMVIATGDSLTATALLTQITGSLAHLFASRVGCRETAGDLLAYFRIPATIGMDAETLDVMMPIDRIDLDVRRAGLDADPGWIPWLRRRVRFEFA
jgi:hypothetical protein